MVYLMDTRFKHHRSVIGIVGKILEMKLVAGCELRGMANDECRMSNEGIYLFYNIIKTERSDFHNSSIFNLT